MDHDPSIEHEPQWSKRPLRPDPADAAADRSGDSADDADRVASEHSVHNEPAMFVEQEGRLIEQDWRCRQCGYNLRGTMTGQRCPECGSIELYAPPPQQGLSYGSWLSMRQAATSAAASHTAVWAVALIGGPFAILGTLLCAPVNTWLVVGVVGPVIEEMMKIAALLWLVEARPYLVRTSNQIFLAAVVSALVYAVIQNALFLTLFPAAAGTLVVAWRWVVCSVFHIGFTLIAANGVYRVWSACIEQHRRPQLSAALPYLIAAMVLHGIYNTTVAILKYSVLLL